jgi:hypothetical protein
MVKLTFIADLEIVNLFGASVPDAFRQGGVDGLAIFSLTLAEQPHLHQELDHVSVVDDACDTDAGTQPTSILPLSDARWRGALGHSERKIAATPLRVSVFAQGGTGSRLKQRFAYTPTGVSVHP